MYVSEQYYASNLVRRNEVLNYPNRKGFFVFQGHLILVYFSLFKLVHKKRIQLCESHVPMDHVVFISNIVFIKHRTSSCVLNYTYATDIVFRTSQFHQ